MHSTVEYVHNVGVCHFRPVTVLNGYLMPSLHQAARCFLDLHTVSATPLGGGAMVDKNDAHASRKFKLRLSLSWPLVDIAPCRGILPRHGLYQVESVGPEMHKFVIIKPISYVLFVCVPSLGDFVFQQKRMQRPLMMIGSNSIVMHLGCF